jgi:hypothetical protein
MELKKYDVQSVEAIYNSYFDSVQNCVKDLLLQKPYNVKEDEVEKFNDRMMKQNDSNENNIKVIITDCLDKKVEAKEAAKKLLDLYFKKTQINFYNKDSVNDVPNGLKERKIFTYTQFVNENKYDTYDNGRDDDEDYGLDYITDEVKLEIGIEIKCDEDNKYFSYEFYNRYDEGDSNVSYGMFECYEQEIHKYLVSSFEDRQLNEQKALAYLYYIGTISYGDLNYGYNLDNYDDISLIETYDTFNNFLDNFYNDIKIDNLKNIDNFVIEQIENNSNKALKNVAFKQLFGYCKKYTKSKYEHYFNAADFDIV